MYRKLTILGGLILAFGAGLMLGIFRPHFFHPRLNSDWFVLSFPSKTKSVFYSAEEIFKSNLSMPDVKILTGAGKFVNDGTEKQSTVRLGYKITVEVSHLNQDKGQKSIKSRGRTDTASDKEIPLVTSSPQGGYKLVPLEHGYEARFYFTLKDRDGFVLMNLISTPNDIIPSKANSFQGLVDDKILTGVASRTTEVTMSLEVKKCLKSAK